jgi:hypothetical protein
VSLIVNLKIKSDHVLNLDSKLTLKVFVAFSLKTAK